MPEPPLIEREKEVALLKEALATLAGDSQAGPRAVFVTGPTGRGRSAILTTAGREASGFKWLKGRWPTGGAGPEALREVLPTSAFTPYDKLRERLAVLERKVEAAQLALGLPLAGEEQEEPRLRAVQAIPPQALHFLIRRIYTVYSPEQMSEQAAAFVKTGLEHILTFTAANLSQLRTFVDEIRQSLSATDWEFYLKPEQGLARALGKGVSTLSRDMSLLITLEDYHFPEGRQENWLRLMVEESGRTLWIFEAENFPGWGEELKLEPLSPSGVATYFEATQGRSLSQEETGWLAQLSGGEPLALAIACELYAKGATRPDLDAAVSRTPDNQLEGLFLYFVEESGRLSAEEQMQLYGLALLRRLDPDFIARFQEAIENSGYDYNFRHSAALFDKYPWLASDNELHPALKNQLRHYLMLEKRRFSQPVQEGVIEPARTAAVALLAARENELVADHSTKGSLSARAHDRRWGERVADVAYYRLWLDEAVGWVFLLPRWLMALAYNEGLARRLLAVAEEMRQTFYTEGQEILPALEALLAPSYSGGRARLDQKLKALEKLEELGTSERGRWYKAENLGLRPQGGGSPEAELRGLLKWFQGQVLEEAGQYDRTAPLYESVLATNVKMPELERAAARTALYMGVRYQLKGANESAYSSFSRAAELDGQPPEVQLALFCQAAQLGYFDTALKAADALTVMPEYEAQGELFTIFALFALDRQPEARTELRTYLTRSSEDTAKARPAFQRLATLAKLPPDTPGLSEILEQLPE